MNIGRAKGEIEVELRDESGLVVPGEPRVLSQGVPPQCPCGAVDESISKLGEPDSLSMSTIGT